MGVIFADLSREEELLPFKKSQNRVNYHGITSLGMSVMLNTSPLCSYSNHVQMKSGPLEETA